MLRIQRALLLAFLLHHGALWGAEAWSFPHGDQQRTHSASVSKLPPYLGSAWAFPTGGEGPVVVSGTVAVTQLAVPPSILALDIRNGKALWQRVVEGWDIRPEQELGLWGVRGLHVYVKARYNDQEVIHALDLHTGEEDLSRRRMLQVMEKTVEVEMPWPQGVGPRVKSLVETETIPAIVPHLEGAFPPLNSVWAPTDFELPGYPTVLGRRLGITRTRFSPDLSRLVVNYTTELLSVATDCYYPCSEGQSCGGIATGICGTLCGGASGITCEFGRIQALEGTKTVILGAFIGEPISWDHEFVFVENGSAYTKDPSTGNLLKVITGQQGHHTIDTGIQADRYVAVGSAPNGTRVLIVKQPLQAFPIHMLESGGAPLWTRNGFGDCHGAMLANGDLLLTDGGDLIVLDSTDGAEKSRIHGRLVRGDNGQLDGGFIGLPVPLENGVLVHRRVPLQPTPLLSLQLEFLGSPSGYPTKGRQLLGRYLNNSLTGNHLLTRTDVAVPGLGLSLEVKRTYNSNRSNWSGPFGKGWTFNFDMELSYGGTRALVLQKPDGGRTRFVLPATGPDLNTPYATPLQLYSTDGVSNRLYRQPDRSLVYRTKDGTRYFFGSLPETRDPDPAWSHQSYGLDGRLLAIEDRNGNRIELTYGTPAGGVWRPHLSQIRDTTGRIYLLSYDGLGHLVRVQGLAGLLRTYDYADGQLVSVHDEKGMVAHYGYGISSGKLETIDDLAAPPGQKHLRIHYDEDSGRVARIHPSNEPAAETRFYYNDQPTEDLPVGAFPAAWQDRSASRTETRINASQTKVVLDLYDVAGRVEARWERFGPGSDDYHKTTYKFDARDNLLWTQDALGQVLDQTVYSDDGRDNKLSVVDAAGGRSEFKYDGEDRVVEAIDATGVKTVFVYDAKGNLLSETRGVEIPASIPGIPGASDGGPLTQSHVYGPKGELLSSVGVDGRESRYQYDEHGNLREARRPGGRRWTYRHDVLSRLLSETDPEGRETTYAYDPAGYLELKRESGGRETTYAYDSNRNLESVTDELGRQTVHVRDQRDRLVEMRFPGGAKRVFEYDLAGGKVSEEDELGHERTYSYDDLGRLKRSTDPTVDTGHGSSGWVEFEYDALGRRVRAETSNGLVSAWEHDALGRTIRTRHHNGNVETRQNFDALGRVISSVNGPRSVIYVYDAHGRVVRTSFGGGVQRLDHVYDEHGDPTELSWYSGGALKQQLRYSFDENHQLTSADIAGLPGLQRHYDYDKTGALMSLKVRLGGPGPAWLAGSGLGAYDLHYSRDVQGRITSVFGSGNIAELGYNSRELLSIRSGNGASSAYAYDNRGRLGSVQHRGSQGLVLQESFSYDDASNVVSRTDELGTATFSYDSLNRLVRAQFPQTGVLAGGPAAAGTVTPAPQPYELQWTYDATGSRLTQTRVVQGQSHLRTFSNVDGQLMGYDGDGATASFSYQQGFVNSAEGAGISYDAFGTISAIGGEQIDRNPFGEVYKRSKDGQVTWVVSAGGSTLQEAEQVDAGTVKLRRVYHHDGAGRVLRKREHSDGQAQPSILDFYYHYDGRSSVAALTDAQGALVQRYHYLPFGEVMEGLDAKNPYGFGGKEGFAEGKLLDFGPRLMGPQAGRFLGPDPVEGRIFGPQKLNRYRYCQNNPLSDTDLSGEYSWLEFKQDAADVWNALTTLSIDPAPAQASTQGNELAEQEGAAVAGVDEAQPSQVLESYTDYHKQSPQTQNAIETGVNAVAAVAPMSEGGVLAIFGTTLQGGLSLTQGLQAIVNYRDNSYRGLAEAEAVSEEEAMFEARRNRALNPVGTPTPVP